MANMHIQFSTTGSCNTSAAHHRTLYSITTFIWQKYPTLSWGFYVPLKQNRSLQRCSFQPISWLKYWRNLKKQNKSKHSPVTQRYYDSKKTEKLTEPVSVAFYDLQLGNRTCTILTASKPTWGIFETNNTVKTSILKQVDVWEWVTEQYSMSHLTHNSPFQSQDFPGNQHWYWRQPAKMCT